MEGHIVRTFDADILNLRIQVLAMGGIAIDQVQRAVRALTRDDEEAAREVISRNAQVVTAARGVEEEIVALIARRQPVASDLRAILTIGRVATDLERVGNAARKIAKLTLELDAGRDGLPLQRFYNDVRKMGRLAVAMLRDALDCFDRVDVERALTVAHRDAEVDSEFQLALRELVTYVMEDQRHLASTIQTVFVLKALERVGDHARNIAGSVPRLVRRDEPAAAAPAPGLLIGAGALPQRDPRALGQG
ncbi:MAG: phosphate signaling complex protein PhoU [Proteobacteria bacterium]|nr:phosphate signaling complex protein PhoU [Pseudomonadota bacterium]